MLGATQHYTIHTSLIPFFLNTFLLCLSEVDKGYVFYSGWDPIVAKIEDGIMHLPRSWYLPAFQLQPVCKAGQAEMIMTQDWSRNPWAWLGHDRTLAMWWTCRDVQFCGIYIDAFVPRINEHLPASRVLQIYSAANVGCFAESLVVLSSCVQALFRPRWLAEPTARRTEIQNFGIVFQLISRWTAFLPYSVQRRDVTSSSRTLVTGTRAKVSKNAS